MLPPRSPRQLPCTVFQRMLCSLSILRSTIARIRGIICFPGSCSFSLILCESCRPAQQSRSEFHGGPSRFPATSGHCHVVVLCTYWPPPLFEQTSDRPMEWSPVWQPSSSSFFFYETKDERNGPSRSQNKTDFNKTGHSRPAWRNSFTTSCVLGTCPSTPPPTRKLSRETATARAALHAKVEAHLNLQACSACI